METTIHWEGVRDEPRGSQEEESTRPMPRPIVSVEGSWWHHGPASAIAAINKRDRQRLGQYLLQTNGKLDPAVSDQLRATTSDAEYQRMMDLFGPKPLNASAYDPTDEFAAELEFRELRFAKDTLARLSLEGHGPITRKVDDWAQANFPEDPPPPTYDARRIPWRPFSADQVHWAVIGEPGAVLERTIEQLLAFGFGVYQHAENPSAALQLAGDSSYEAAFVDARKMSYPQLACITDWFIERRVRYVVMPNSENLTPRIRDSGIVLHDLTVCDFAAAVMRCIPLQLRHRFQLDAIVYEPGGPQPDLTESSVIFPAQR